MARKSSKTKPPKARVTGRGEVWELVGTRDSLSEWSSLVGDLTSPAFDDPTWRVHDRTHLELGVDYRLTDLAAGGKSSQQFEWEAYFFVPKSLRLNSDSYRRTDIYRDLQSYVRYAVPPIPLEDLCGVPLSRLREAITAETTEKALIRELRIFACLVRATITHSHRVVKDLDDDDIDPRAVEAAALELLQRIEELTASLRDVLALSKTTSEESQAALRWVDEDVSRFVETVLASLSIEMRNGDFRSEVSAAIAYGAVEEARYRREKKLDAVGHADAGSREVEHLEFRRHVLKRFTTSVLWLSRDVSDAATWISQALYAVAASVAMAFAVVAAVFHGPQWQSGNIPNLWMWSILVVLAYALKDRIKAGLQQVFSRWVSKRFPDRRWVLHDPEVRGAVGTVTEHSAFVSRSDLPSSVSDVRNATRRLEVEEQSRPERVLWHRKEVVVRAKQVEKVDDRFHALREIFRLDLRKWLVHTDDPKQRIVFADPDDERVYSATAPRVYNIGIVYRLRRLDDDSVPWQRVRVVVSRKGILRIDQVTDIPLGTSNS